MEATVWTERMVSAAGERRQSMSSGRAKPGPGGRTLVQSDGQGVRAGDAGGGLGIRVRANRGAAGVDGVSIERFAARSGEYLAELATDLREGR